MLMSLHRKSLITAVLRPAYAAHHSAVSPFRFSAFMLRSSWASKRSRTESEPYAAAIIRGVCVFHGAFIHAPYRRRASAVLRLFSLAA
ncbi:hypothetical protein BJX62DRAFT_218758 [Aspergillus germanicus]